MSDVRCVLNAEQILASDDLVRVWVSTPEWKTPDMNGDECGVYVTTLDGREKEHWEEEITDARGLRDKAKVGILMATALSRSCVDEGGNRIFTAEQVEKIAGKSGAVLVRLFKVFRQLNVITDADMDEMVKN